MRPGRELDVKIAEEIFGRQVYVKKHILFEKTEEGERPLRSYSKEIADAWEVVEKLSITLLPIEETGGDLNREKDQTSQGWFALVGRGSGWKSPADFMQYLQTGNFVDAGAAVAATAPLAICMAALRSHAVKTMASPDVQPQQTH